MFFDLTLSQLLADLVEGLDGLALVIRKAHSKLRRASTHLLSDQRLLDRGQVLQRRQKHVCMFWSSNVFCEVAQFLAQRGQNLVLILDGI